MAADSPTSPTLLAGLRAGDAAAWRRLVDLYGPVVRFWCERWGVRGPDAEDVAQEVFGAVSAGLAGFRRDRPGDTFRGWLRGITRHKALDALRRAGDARAEGGTDARALLERLPDAGEPPEEEGEAGELYRRAVELVRSSFEERTFQMFWRSVVEGHATDAIAADMGVTPVAVRVARSRVLARLRREVGELE